MRQLNLELKEEEQEIKEFVHQNQALPAPISFKGESVFFERTHGPIERKIKNEYRFERANAQKRPRFHIYRKIEFPIYLKDQWYSGTVVRSQAETEDLIQLLALCTLGLMALLIITLSISNRLIMRKLWIPFQNTLDKAKAFNLSGDKPIQLENSNIDEFNELNSALTVMAKKARTEYESLKSFSENASHEIQTPLAIIKSNLEVLMQTDLMNEAIGKNIQNALNASQRLSKMTASLLLLTKIENRQFVHICDVDLWNVTDEILDTYEELMQNKNIEIRKNITAHPIVKMNDVLAEVLISNLIKNAIRHNLESGFIEINATKNFIEFANPGAKLNISPEELFQRFKKETNSNQSLGLGLSISQLIAEQYHLKLDYIYENQLHKLKIQIL